MNDPVDVTRGDADDRAVVVLGGGSDIGLAIARELVARGASRVVLAGRHPSEMRVRAIHAGIRAPVATVHFDATAPESHVRAVHEAFSHAGGVQVVVIAFGILPKPGDQDDAAHAGRIALTNFAGGVSAALATVKALVEQTNPGALVILSSGAALRPRPSNYLYGATKAGLDFFARGLADSARAKGVHVMVARLGFVETKMTAGIQRRLQKTTPARVAADIVDDLERGRMISWSPPVLRWLALPIQLLPQCLIRRF